MKGLHGWMRALEDNDAAVLSTLLKELDQITASDESSGAQLAEVILKDVQLTANIIRVANTVTFNPSSISVTTISRAILNIGFKNIRSICLSVKVLESVLKDSPSPLLIAMLARSLHSATQAKELCSSAKFNNTEREEVFVASLLSHLAELLVLGFRDEDVKKLKHEIEPSSSTEEKNRCAEKFLGVSLTRLAKTLTKQWRIEGLVNEVLSGIADEDSDPRIQAVILGDEISRAALLGWDSVEFKEVSQRVAEFKNIGEMEAAIYLKDVADETAKTVSSFGKKVLVDHIPTSKRPAVSIEKKTDQEEEGLKANMAFELEVTEHVDKLLDENFNINQIFKLVLKGLNKGVGLERVALAIFDKEHQKVAVKYAAGTGTEKWRETFVVRYERSHSGFLYNLFERDQAAWIGHSDYKHISQFLSPEYVGITGQKKFFIAPLMAGRKRIGFIYADMGVSSRELNDTYFEGYHKFLEKAKLALEKLASRS
jgi:HD-like signal output (HDOD) protein